ncbi:hypothetical protein M409DRAFT_19877 [Zasmidium cellare ATCC 36951]|uniref:Mitochondrial distribution and morphology protein 12 n=1 Tax=Zasmidium cellare ATCC 36951 TaxID=1080233 RepID=A0A6A6CSZ9_ZASCE|nr:uncharacterized protein M409DRAFT_19877 [Zasmidium cellare ATCC 36951]KAF2170274.1 hypothetical protein M409DRAFT_19877 [Zasmidium cellare ATCC 36951]
MSVDINWETLTGGSDGAALAETIRSFVHERFQSIPLPKLIRSVSVHGFEFGKVCPDIVLKDITDPLPDFYETDEGEDAHATGSDGDITRADVQPDFQHSQTRHVRGAEGSRRLSEIQILDRASTTGLTRNAAPGVLGTTSNLGYFHLPLSAGLPGTQTPLAAVAGAHYATGNQAAPIRDGHPESFSSASPASAATPTSSHGHTYFDRPAESNHSGQAGQPEPSNEHQFDQSPEDLQIVFRVTYSGDVRLSLTADVFLDYPMPSFVGIPLKLRITGLAFDGVGILAYIKKRAHLCFLNPEDADALVGGEHGLDPFDDSGHDDHDASKPGRVGGLLEDIKIESEMGGTDGGKQVLKNVDKIEKFILEQVQRIFEDEFVYPSFWTFLV